MRQPLSNAEAMTERERLDREWRKLRRLERRVWRAYFFWSVIISIAFLASIPFLARM